MSFRKDFVWGAATAVTRLKEPLMRTAEENPFWMCIAMTRVRTLKENRIF